MAILIDFRKTREDATEVEYIFGYPEMDRRLVIDKESQEGTPLDGEKDKSYWPVFVKILRGYASLGYWPRQGSYAA